MRALVAPLLLALVSGCRTPSEGTPAPTASASASVAAPSSAAPAQATSSSARGPLTPQEERAAQAAIVSDCLACHDEQMLAQQRLTEKQWAAVVKKMQGWGSQVDPASVDPLVGYLSTRYGTGAPDYRVPTLSAAAASEALEKTPDGPFAGGDAKRGEELYKEGCVSCHGVDARGSSTGMNLRDRPGLYRAAEFVAPVQKGRGRMPAFPMYKDADIAAILAYLRALPP